MRLPLQGRLALLLLVLVGLSPGSSGAFAQSTGNLLSVTEAYKLTADTSTPGAWRLAQSCLSSVRWTSIHRRH